MQLMPYLPDTAAISEQGILCPAVILVDEHHVQLMERRETYDDLLAPLCRV